MTRNTLFLKFMLGLGFVFLYLPIVILIVFSFNDSRRVNVWGGFSTRWYRSILEDSAIIDAVRNTLVIAALSATMATIIGTLAAIVLVKFGRFRGRMLFTGMMSAPLVMPEVITGISLLLMFIFLKELIGWPAQRGILTVTIGHVTFCTAYVAVIVQSRLVTLDASLEEAAMDLGSKPGAVFFKITAPLIFPALLAGWLLSFTLSMDDLVVASFTSGPGATTLPMLIFSKVRFGVSPDINAVASIMVFVVATGVTIGTVFLHRQDRRKQMEMNK